MINVILCDVDGVLIVGETFPVSLARDYGITRETTAAFFQGRFIDCVLGRADLMELLPAHLPNWGWMESAEEFVDYWFKVHSQINSTLVSWLQDWRRAGVPCFLATVQERHRAAYLRELLAVGRDFDGMFVSWELGQRKDSPAFFEKILSQLPKVLPSEVLFIDDSSANLVAAREVGMTTELFTGNADLDYLLTHYSLG